MLVASGAHNFIENYLIYLELAREPTSVGFGQRYFLGIRNVADFVPTAFVLNVDADVYRQNVHE